ncbi:protein DETOXIFICATION 42 [Cinnamomum micranthum f. kanehirae]|uniref:Protein DETOXIFICATION n=1 Tax=Cinnamomum micranthum f. kanehirae TaxID=337451 RepID=A0A3S3MDF5_9MAGN|nr:protein DETOXIFICATION 42 [Cinnamomum micranthum f. kanehirae]
MDTPGALPEDDITGSSGNERINPLGIFFKDLRLVFKKDELGIEIFQIALPAALALAADPIASLVDTAFIGHIGPVELAAVGVAIAVFNQVSKIAIFPLVSITTSFVAEEDATSKIRSIEEEETDNMEKALPKSSEMKESSTQADTEDTEHNSSFLAGKNQRKPRVASKKKHIPSVSTALVIGGVLGLLQAILLIFSAKPALRFMGVHSDSPMLAPARKYLTLRSLGSPAVLLSLAMQGVFRGFKDTKTPLYATVIGDVANIILDPILMFSCRLGVSGAAIAHVVSQYLISLIMLLRLMRKVEILPPSVRDLQFGRFLKSGGLLLARVVAVTFCVTLAASMAARHGSISMAAFQVCLQIWLTTSLLADGLAVAAQAILASAFARKDHTKVVAATARVLQLGLVMGLALAVLLGIVMQFAWRIFTKDVKVMQLMRLGIPFVAATQPLNSLAFVFDGINFGASDFAYTAYSMVVVSAISIASLFLLSSSHGFVGIWTALTIYMSLRMFAGYGRIGIAKGPWKFLRG